MVRRLDRSSAERILPRDRKRLIRALEVYFQTGKPLSMHFADTVSPLPPATVVTALALRMEPGPLAERLARRVDAQLEAGLVDEVRGLLAQGVPPTARPFGGLVYRQVMDYLAGVRDLAATRDLIVQENRRYARRQLIWFRKEPNLIWFDGPGESARVQARVRDWLAATGPAAVDGGPAAHG
jgi:tRNA dimethylallyltransferase